MSLLAEGIQLGLLLAVLTGPIFFALVQAGVEQGFRAGLAVGLGIWVSDLLFILAVYGGFQWVSQLVAWPGFSLSLGLTGSLVLVGFGLYTLLTPALNFNDRAYLPRHRHWTALWLKGFLINTLNPFTVFFWSGIMTGIVIKRHLALPDAALLFGGILLTIIATDTAKILLARQIRHKLQAWHFIWLRRATGLAFIIFGLALAWRVWP